MVFPMLPWRFQNPWLHNSHQSRDQVRSERMFLAARDRKTGTCRCHGRLYPGTLPGLGDCCSPRHELDHATGNTWPHGLYAYSANLFCHHVRWKWKLPCRWLGKWIHSWTHSCHLYHLTDRLSGAPFREAEALAQKVTSECAVVLFLFAVLITQLLFLLQRKENQYNIVVMETVENTKYHFSRTYTQWLLRTVYE